MNGPRVELEDAFPAGSLFAQGDDVILVPHSIDFPDDAVDLSTRLSLRVPLFIPCIASPMDTVSEAATAVGMAALGGPAIVHCNVSPALQAAIVRSAKSRRIPLVTDPAFFAPSERIAYLSDFSSGPYALVTEFGTAKSRAVGGVARSDWEILADKNAPILEYMRPAVILSTWQRSWPGSGWNTRLW